MPFELERIHRILKDLKKFITKDSLEITNYKFKKGNSKGMESPFIDDSTWDDYTTGDLWGGYDQHAWFRTTFTIPKHFHNQQVVFTINTGHLEGWDISNPQFLAYLDGTIVQGLDVNHRNIIIDKKAKAGKSYNIALLGYSGLNQERVYLKSELIIIDEKIKDFYYNLNNLFWTACILEEDDTNRIHLMNNLNKAISYLDLRKIYSNDFYTGLEKANSYLIKNYYSTINKDCPTVTAIGHTHIDIAWLWSVSQTKEKVVRSFSTVLYLMDQFPEYKFMSSQPLLYQFLKEEEPQLFEKVKEKVKEGRWEVDGAMWVEADCNIPSGESLVRQILMGTRFFKDEFGIESKTLWLPDVFGYCATLPQIMKKSGLQYFFTTKLDWNQFNKMPHDSFIWKGIDGSEVFTQLITTTNHVTFDNEVRKRKNKYPQTTYNGRLNPNQVLGNWTRYQDKSLTNETLQLFGFGDGGGGPTEEMLENAKRLKYGLPGLPRVNIDFQRNFFDRVYHQAKNHPSLPQWVGELYFECHRGTYTSIAKNKRYNRKAEFLYSDIETLYSLNKLINGYYPKEAIHNAWKTILLNQFHDIIPGTAIEEVYTQTDLEYENLLAHGENLLNDAMTRIASQINLTAKSLVVFNTLSYNRDDIVEFELPENENTICLKDTTGSVIPVQKIPNTNRAVFFAENVPSKGYKAYQFVFSSNSKKEEYANKSATWSNQVLDTPFFKITFDDNYFISSLWDKNCNREVICKNQKGNVFQVFEDRPMDFENWDIDIYFKDKVYEVSNVSDIKLLENGSVRTCLQITRTYYDSTITQKIYVYKNVPKIDFKTDVDWHEKHVLLKVAFPVDIHTDKASYEIQYGNVERPTHNNTSWDLAQFEVCAHKWVDLSETGYGVSLLNDCKYGHDIKGNCIRLTLIKCGEYPNPNADIGHHEFTYSLYPHKDHWKFAQTQQYAYNLNVPMHSIIQAPTNGILADELSMVSIDSSNCIIEVVKASEDKDYTLIRLYEYTNKRTRTTIATFKEIDYVYECDLLENKTAQIKNQKNNFTIEVMPFEIKTYLIKFK